MQKPETLHPPLYSLPVNPLASSKRLYVKQRYFSRGYAYSTVSPAPTPPSTEALIVTSQQMGDPAPNPILISVLGLPLFRYQLSGKEVLGQKFECRVFGGESFGEHHLQGKKE